MMTLYLQHKSNYTHITARININDFLFKVLLFQIIPELFQQ